MTPHAVVGGHFAILLEEKAMILKILAPMLAIALMAAAPLSAFAQSSSSSGLTRAEVRADLIRLEQAGYNPATANDSDYPANIQAAEARAYSNSQSSSVINGQNAYSVAPAASAQGSAGFSN